jgi:hypothetical protein
MIRGILICCLLLGPLAAAASPPEGQNLGAHRMLGMEDFQQIVDSKCTVCHTRERVDIAIRQGQDMGQVEQRMIERGAVLTEREKSVLGTFWGSPLKEGK